ncbi:hypothetical protein BSL78_03912 [Apostichopus japonicus]|uniref:Uncharacterized protein n=1 Tax=Stichopus japonicus TaxID=307972 RepID=A0A2G8LFZ7_STIJA|nr:hypothetical protein BSL78_03912 [Apostichopus japonicus]
MPSVYPVSKKAQEIRLSWRQSLAEIRPMLRWTNNNWLSNDELYNETNQTPWSSIVAHRRLRFFGHVARLQEDAPAKIALREALRHTAKPVGRPVTTLLGKIKSQFKDVNINNFEEAINLAQDRDRWRRLITEHVGYTVKKNGKPYTQNVRNPGFPCGLLWCYTRKSVKVISSVDDPNEGKPRGPMMVILIISAETSSRQTILSNDTASNITH